MSLTKAGTVTIVFKVVGNSTRQMATYNVGDCFCDVVGPLGRPSELVHIPKDKLKEYKVAFVGGGVGIAPDADILALKIDFSFEAIDAAIRYAVNQKVDVINMSLGAYSEVFTDGFGDVQNEEYSAAEVSGVATYLNSACQNAYNNGIIVVAAAGNTLVELVSPSTYI